VYVSVSWFYVFVICDIAFPALLHPVNARLHFRHRLTATQQDHDGSADSADDDEVTEFADWFIIFHSQSISDMSNGAFLSLICLSL
jgi:hypothetical protein